jgi:hypothetical protein
MISGNAIKGIRKRYPAHHKPIINHFTRISGDQKSVNFTDILSVVTPAGIAGV